MKLRSDIWIATCIASMGLSIHLLCSYNSKHVLYPRVYDSLIQHPETCKDSRELHTVAACIKLCSHGHTKALFACTGYTGVPYICMQAIAFMSVATKQLHRLSCCSQFDIHVDAVLCPRMQTMWVCGHTPAQMSKWEQRPCPCSCFIPADMNRTACYWCMGHLCTLCRKTQPSYGCTLVQNANEALTWL